MEFQVRVPDLSKALHRVQGIVEKKTTMPVIANVLIRSQGKDKITVSATDLEIGLTSDYEAKVINPGAMCVSAKALFDIVRSLPEQTVTLKLASNQWVEIRCGKVKYRLIGLDATTFPSLPKTADVPFFSIDPKVFGQMIDATLYAVSTDETRYNLTGAFMQPLAESAGLRMVATDGHRLAIVERVTEAKPVLSPEGVLIPRKGLIEIRKLLEDGTGEVRLGFVGSGAQMTNAVIEKNAIALTVRLVDGKFPDWQQVVPHSASMRVSVSRAKLIAALKRTSLLSPDKAQGVSCQFTAGPDGRGEIVLSTHNPDLGEASESVEAEGFTRDIKIGFNFRYVLDALGVLSEETIAIEMNDELAPGVIVGDVASDRAVVMPMRV